MVIIKKIEKLIVNGRLKLFYNWAIWKRKRKQILVRDNFECQRCKGKGRYSKATVVHHIKHIDVRPDLALIDDNLISLCDACHNLEHPEKLQTVEIKRRREITPERW